MGNLHVTDAPGQEAAEFAYKYLESLCLLACWWSFLATIPEKPAAASFRLGLYRDLGSSPDIPVIIIVIL